MRVNKRGQFNVPPGSYKNPDICNAELIRCDSEALQGTLIRHSKTVDTINSLGGGIFLLFVDPPYYDDKKKFTGYSGEFAFEDQAALVSCILNSGQPFIYTNKAHPAIVECFSKSGTSTRIVPLRHSVQPKYTAGIVEQELIAWRL
jgi:DNA adenine methylase